MTTLLHVDSSIGTPEDSVSRRLTALFARHWQARHGTGGYRYRDLAADPVSLIGPAFVRLGQRADERGVLAPHKVDALIENPAEQREWALTRPLVEEVLAADTLLVGVPMYNFTVPAVLKAWIERIGFPGAFADPDSGESLLGGTRVVVVAARGGGYGPGTPRAAFDFQLPYLRAYFGDLGVTDLHVVHAELTRAAAVPALAPLRALGESSLAAARATVVDLTAA